MSLSGDPYSVHFSHSVAARKAVEVKLQLSPGLLSLECGTQHAGNRSFTFPYPAEVHEGEGHICVARVSVFSARSAPIAKPRKMLTVS